MSAIINNERGCFLDTSAYGPTAYDVSAPSTHARLRRFNVLFAAKYPREHVVSLADVKNERMLVLS